MIEKKSGSSLIANSACTGSSFDHLKELLVNHLISTRHYTKITNPVITATKNNIPMVFYKEQSKAISYTECNEIWKIELFIGREWPV